MKINKLHFALNLNLTYLLIIKKKLYPNNYSIIMKYLPETIILMQSTIHLLHIYSEYALFKAFSFPIIIIIIILAKIQSHSNLNY
jgi:hypothetical protein